MAGTHTGTDNGHSGFGTIVMAESETEDSVGMVLVGVLVVVVVPGRLWLLTFVKMKGLA